MIVSLNSLILLSLGLCLGSVTFFSFFVAPLVFQVMTEEQGGRFLRTIFPRYYKLGIVCGVLLSGGVATRMFLGGLWGVTWLILLGCALLITLIDIYALMLIPRINEARDAGDAQKELFDRLHRRSVQLNGVVLLGGLIAFICLGSLLT